MGSLLSLILLRLTVSAVNLVIEAESHNSIRVLRSDADQQTENRPGKCQHHEQITQDKLFTAAKDSPTFVGKVGKADACKQEGEESARLMY